MSQKPVRLFFDARYIRTDFHDGISRYSAELGAATAALAADRNVEVTFLIFDDRQRVFLPEGAAVLKIHPPTALREPLTARVLNRHRPDVVFSPMQTIGSRGRRFGLILTLHDMIYYRHRTPPKNMPWYVRVGWRLYHLSYVPQRVTLNAADVIATVSQTSKEQFAAARLTRRPVVVIPNAPQDLASLLPDGTPVRSGSANLVYMGSFMPYKNVPTLILAMRDLPGHTLHLLSRITPERKREYQRLAGADVELIFHDGVTDAEYAQVLADRAVLVTASRDEGYGLPVAEALKLGVPAVVTDMDIFHEVAGAGALYADPDDPASFAAAVATLDDPDIRNSIVVAGRAHIDTFGWPQSAAVLLDTVEELASSRPGLTDR